MQVLVATSTLAWGVNTPAHLVIIKGTEYFDAPSRHALSLPASPSYILGCETHTCTLTSPGCGGGNEDELRKGRDAGLDLSPGSLCVQDVHVQLNALRQTSTGQHLGWLSYHEATTKLLAHAAGNTWTSLSLVSCRLWAAVG